MRRGPVAGASINKAPPHARGDSLSLGTTKYHKKHPISGAKHVKTHVFCHWGIHPPREHQIIDPCFSGKMNRDTTNPPALPSARKKPTPPSTRTARGAVRLCAALSFTASRVGGGRFVGRGPADEWAERGAFGRNRRSRTGSKS